MSDKQFRTSTWLNLEAGTARSLSRRHGVAFDVPPSPDPRWHGMRALVVEAAATYLPEAAVPSLPEIAAAEIAHGLGGRLRNQIAATDPDNPELPALRDRLIAALGGTPDVSGALSVTDRVYANRAIRNEVPAIIGASCIAWYGHWRAGNGGPDVDTARELHGRVAAWAAHPDRRSEIERVVRDLLRKFAGDQSIALEQLPV